MAEETDCYQIAPAHGTHLSCVGKAGLVKMPQELLRIVASDAILTNHDRKQARLACRALESAMRPFVFRRALISRLRADRDAFLSIAAAPRLAACVEEVVWLELGCDGLALDILPSVLEGYYDLREHLQQTAGDLFWLSKSGKAEAKEFSGQFKDAIACMPKLRGFSSEPMRSDRVLCSQPDKYPLEVGLLTTHAPRDMRAWTQGLMRFLLPTMRKDPGKITRLRYSAGLFKTDSDFGNSLFKSHMPAVFKHLTSINLTYSWAEWRNWAHWRYPSGSGYAFLRSLQSALFAASDLQELSIAFDCGLEGYGPAFRLPDWMFKDEDGKFHKWKRLKSLRFAYLMKTENWLVPMIAAHADTLRHLDLEHCNLEASFAMRLAHIKGGAPQLHSITINEPGVRESALISEQKLLDYIHHGAKDEDKKWVETTGKDLSSDAGGAEENSVTEAEEDVGDEGGHESEDSDFNPEFEYTAEAEEDYNSDEEPPPVLRSVKSGCAQIKKIGASGFVTHSNVCENVADSDCDDADDDGASDHSSEWWSDTDSSFESTTIPPAVDLIDLMILHKATSWLMERRM